MQYINVTTEEVISHAEVCKRTNTSIPSGQDFGDWQAISAAPVPEASVGFHVESDGVKNIDGRFMFAWKVVADADMSNVVPSSITRFQGIAQLDIEGLLDEVETYMALDTTPRLQKLAWKEVLVFERNSPTVQLLASVLNKTEEELDQFFIAADKIKA